MLGRATTVKGMVPEPELGCLVKVPRELNKAHCTVYLASVFVLYLSAT